MMNPSRLPALNTCSVILPPPAAEGKQGPCFEPSGAAFGPQVQGRVADVGKTGARPSDARRAGCIWRRAMCVVGA